MKGLVRTLMKALPLLVQKLSRLKVFEKKVKFQSQGHKLNNYDTVYY